jgi:aspartyl/asparaginyl beta-hydroxylase (cupin superfamily)
LEEAGHLRNGFVSRLRPGSVIHPHRGWTNQYLRIHMGLLCDPACRLTVGTETHAWRPGQLLAFKDGGPYLHSVRHDGSRDRVVVSFDLRLSYVAPFIPGILGSQPAA